MNATMNNATATATKTDWTREQLEALPASELRAVYYAFFGKPPRTPNRGWQRNEILARQFDHHRESLALAKAAKKPAAQPEPKPELPEEEPAQPAAEHTEEPQAAASKLLREMTVDELRAEYARVVQRPTGSTDRNYLMWKIRETAKGKLPTGPSERRQAASAEEHVVLPLRMPKAEVAELDRAWRERGAQSRMDFMRKALSHYLQVTK